MKLGHPLGKVVIHLLILVEPCTEHRIVDGLAAGQDEADIILCDLHDEACAVLVKMVLLHPSEKILAAHGGQYDAVFDLHIAYLPRC